jgi:hypothetical protein
MTALTALLALGLAAAVLFGAGWLACGRLAETYSGLFRASDLGWPRGVQEEDPVAWNWTPRPDEPVDAAPPPAATAPVAARVGRGPARRGRR